MVLNSMTERQIGTLQWEEAQALSAAETGVAFAVRAIHDMDAPLADEDGDGRPDFQLAANLSNGSSYQVVAETSDMLPTDHTAYRSEFFTVLSEGRRGQAIRRVSVELGHETFLKYQRFCGDDTPGYDCGSVVAGEVYAKGDLWIPTDCGTHPVEFLEPVMVRQTVRNPQSAVFHRGYSEYADLIDLPNSVDFAHLRSRARGLLTRCDCEGRGEVGIYFDLGAGSFPLIATEVSASKTFSSAFDDDDDDDDDDDGGNLPALPTIEELDLGEFDFFDAHTRPGDTLVTYAGVEIRNPLTNDPLRAAEFNGLLFCEGDLPLKGRLDGKSGRCLTIVANHEIHITGDLICGHTGYDLKTGLPTGTGEPVNLGLVARRWIRISPGTSRILRIDAALLSVNESWLAEGDLADHPAAAMTVHDLDLDGIAGESPVNDDPYVGRGWDELNITADTWVLNFTGPLITWKRGDSGPWKDPDVLAKASDMTRRYSYDLDIQSYPPPCFPVPINLWKELSWSEVRDTQRELLSYVLIER
ncbi:MAG: hypothetical protein GF330_03295 [Candidatus Eisenbacteria bacterium]|nr:hypothetical protein [Candidatus Eisenbacteria bacterium]